MRSRRFPPARQLVRHLVAVAVVVVVLVVLSAPLWTFYVVAGASASVWAFASVSWFRRGSEPQPGPAQLSRSEGPSRPERPVRV